MQNISIINYGLGNIHSILNALSIQGFNVKLVSTPEEIVASSHVILPGVGAFQHAMEELKLNGIDEAIREFKQSGRPMLGICLGMQLLLDSSEENGWSEGLGLISGTVNRFPKKEGYTIPQIQWNRVECSKECSLMQGIENSEFFYFLHSYYVAPKANDANRIGCTNYSGIDFVSLIESENVMGVQFHPEKSAEAGLKLLNNFIVRND